MRHDPLDAQTPWSQAWTVADPLTFAGVGLHAGTPATARVIPAPAGHGLVFHRVDLPGSPGIPATWAHVVDTRLSTTLAKGEARISTVEHLLAALWGMGVSDARLEVDGPEVPILDGSARPYAEAIAETGVRVLDAPRRVQALPNLGLTEGDKAVSAVPDDACKLTCVIDFGQPHAGPQIFHCTLTPRVFYDEIAAARTFCFRRDVEAMREAGLARGGSLDNAIVLDADGPSSPLRFSDELARHKALDLLGDLALLGSAWCGHVLAVKAGHPLHTRFARAIAERVPVATSA
ncbi:MAG TPA: UDP-3-O-acyl-N-acetylglucosamine deacetylase [Oscillatoriaceae cyanobacterium]